MELPRLRLRRVFEHGPSFKVQRAGMPALTIAKKALSPNLQAKLRKYAEGGDVTGEAAPAVEEAKPSDELDIPQGSELSQSPLSQAGQQAFGQFAASDMTQSDLEGFSKATSTLPEQEQSRLMQMATDAFQKRQTAGKPESFSAADQQPAVQPAATAATMPAPAAPVAAPAAAADLMGPPEMVGPPAPAGVPAAAPAMVAAAPVVPAAPVAPAAPAVPVAPAKPAAPEIKIPDTITGTTVEDFKAAIKANPQADPAAVAMALVTAKAPQITPPNFDQITDAAPAGQSKTAIEKFDAAVAAKAAALTEEAKADFETKQDIVRIAQASEARQLAAAKKSADMDAVFKGRREALARAFGTDEKGRPLPIEESLARGFQAKSMWGRMSTPQKIGSLISLAVGGFLSGYTDTKNYVYEAFNNLLENDLDAQKSNYNSLVKQYERLLGDEAAARKLAAADLLDLTALQAKSVEARSNLRGIGPQLAAVRADLEMKAAANREEVRKKMFDADIAEINADTQRGLREAEEKAKLAKAAPKVAKTKPVAPTVAPGASALDAFNAITDAKQRGRYIVRTKDPLTKEVVEFPVAERQQRFVQDELDRRQGGLEKIRRVRTILAKRPSVIKGEELGQLQAAISDFWANFPDAEGKNRILPLADKDLIMNATLETGIPFVKFADLAGKTSAAMKEFERSTVEGIKNKIEGAGLVGHPGKDQLVSAYDAFLRGETRPRTPAPSPAKTGEGEGTKPQYMKMRAPQGFKNKAGKDLSGQVLGIPMDQVAGARSAGFVEVP